MKKVLVLDFGGQYNLLVARRVRECGVYCEIRSWRESMENIRAFQPDALIFTGGPATVFEPNAPMVDPALFSMGIPVLGICYGQQLMIHLLGGQCRRAETREYGKVELTHNGKSPLFKDIPATAVYWMSHGVEVETLAPGFEVVASTDGCRCAAIQCAEKQLYGVQFHPEVLHTQYGKEPFRLSEIRTVPFYACKLSGMALATLDGIKINTKFQALDENNAPIEGLYVIGNDSGNYYNGTYPNLAAGLNAGRCVTFGMLCGRQVANL